MDRSARRTIQVSKTFSDSLLSTLRLHFSSCDANNDGLLDENEFVSFLVQAVGYKPETTPEEARELIQLITRKTQPPFACNFFQIIQNFELLKAGVIGTLHFRPPFHWVVRTCLFAFCFCVCADAQYQQFCESVLRL
jgi:hypothetical protein